MSGSWRSRWPFLAAVALIAAAVSDLLVEAIANTGAFGAAFFDTNDTSILPSLAIAMVLAATVIGGYMRAACRRSRAGRRDWFARAAAEIARRAPWRDVGYVIGAQFAALFIMESAEQLLARGHLAGGLLWLGGPVLAGLTLHIAVGVACTLSAAWLIRVSAPHFVFLVCSALEFVLCARGLTRSAAFVARRGGSAATYAAAAVIRHISGRAPPHSLAIA